MNQTALKLLEYDKVKEKLINYAISEPGKALVNKIGPSTDKPTIEGWLRETTEAKAIIARNSSLPLHSLSGLEVLLKKFGKGMALNPEELTIIADLLRCSVKLKQLMRDKEIIAPLVSTYAMSMYELPELTVEIDKCIVNGRVDDRASTDLARVRKKIGVVEDRIESKLQSMLRSPAYRDYIQDSVVSTKNGAFVIPVKREHRKAFDGDVLDTSSSGSTVFIEPAAIKSLREELNLLRLEEDKEVYRILSYLTGMAEGFQKELSINIETMAYYDFLFAKAKYSREINGNTVELNNENYINIISGRHPLITGKVVPLDFTIGTGYRALAITGPNTGGKTIVLKTVGLLTMMVQSGMHVPVETGSSFAVFADVLADIGDGQSIEQSLSTFSSHIRNIISILECAAKDTLVIMDELGTGTDPSEGMGLAIAVMEEIFEKGATMVTTSHFSEIKEFAAKAEGFENGCMEFDLNTLKPLYRLQIGKPGKSNAFLISLRLGMEKRIIERAHRITYKEGRDYSTVVWESEEGQLKNNEVIEAHIETVKSIKNMQEARKTVEKHKVEHTFKLGDCVYISSMDRIGVVCELENTKGEVGVMVMKKRLKINKKRLSLYIDGKELYPEDYNFDIVFETVENRKKRKKMSKRHVEGMTIEVE